MISVKKDFLKKPKDLQGDNPEITSEVKKILNQLYNYKCAYCETKANAKSGHYIHQHRPIKIYPMLKFEWSNLLPVCTDCNSAISGSFSSFWGNKEKEKPINEDFYRANSDFFKTEFPQILHPEVDTIENYFSFDFSGKIYSNSEKGNDLIRLFDLNRNELVKKRYGLYSIFEERLKRIILFNEDDLGLFNDLYHSTLPNSEFSLHGQQMFYDFERFLFSEVINSISENETSDTYKAFGEFRKQEILKAYRNFYAKKLNVKWIDNSKIGIIKFNLKKFQAIEDITQDGIPVNTQWIFFTGKNGYGKTSILRALALGLIRSELKHLKIDENTRSEIVFFQDRRFNQFVYGANNYTRTYFPYVATYGAKRTDLSDKENSKSCDSLFEKTSKLYDFETKYKEWLIFPKENKTKIENFNKILKAVIPNLSKVDVDKETSQVIYYEKTENNTEYSSVTFNGLAMGMRSIMAMITDMVYRLTDFKFDFKFENGQTDIKGIVLIDELDNHLHPSWQRDLVKKISDLFPKIQLIVSTHSPIPLLGAPPERTVILNVNRTKEEGIIVKRLTKLEKELKYLLPNQLLTSDIFGLEEIENIYLKNDELDKVPVENIYNDITKNEAIRKDLERRANKDELFPDDLFSNNK